MPLAPASSLGAFLKARLAVNGMPCGARSFGTLTLGAAGLLSSMGTSLRFSGSQAGSGKACPALGWQGGYRFSEKIMLKRRWLARKLSASRRDGNANRQRYLLLS